MTVTIQTEPFDAQKMQELLPLIRKGWDECSAIKADSCAYHGDRDFLIQPDVETYQRLANAGSLVLVTLREDGVLRGYVEGFLYRALHHTGALCAFGDAIYIEPGYRSHVLKLIVRFEDEMRKLKAEIIGWPTHINGPLYAVLKAHGFVGDDIVMEKRLCA